MIEIKEKVLVYNAIKTPDSTIIESTYRHDYKNHKDLNGKMYIIDGGLDYIRSSNNGDETNLAVYSDEAHKKVREFAFRSSSPKKLTENYIITRICNMSDEYLLNSIEYLKNYNSKYKVVSIHPHYQILINEKEFRKL